MKDSQVIVAKPPSCSFSVQHSAFPSHRAPNYFIFGGGEGGVITTLLHSSLFTITWEQNPKFQPSLCKNRKEFFCLLSEASDRTQDYRGCSVNGVGPEEQPRPSVNNRTRATRGSWSDSGITYSAHWQWSGCEAVWHSFPLFVLKSRTFSCASWWTLEVYPLS